jgi:hypothetical protein
MDSSRTPAVSQLGMIDSGALRATLPKVNKLNDQKWVAEIFEDIVTAIIERINDDRIKKCKPSLAKVFGVLTYNVGNSTVFIQHFVDTIFTFRTEPESNSFVLIMSRFGGVDSAGLNGEVKTIVPEADIRNFGTSTIRGYF